MNMLKMGKDDLKTKKQMELGEELERGGMEVDLMITTVCMKFSRTKYLIKMSWPCTFYNIYIYRILKINTMQFQ